MPDRKWLYPFGILVMIVGLILHSVGMATSQWLVCEYDGKTCYFDLWDKTVCREEGIKSVDPYKGEYPELTAVRTMAATGLVSSAGAIVSAILYKTVEKAKLFRASSIAIFVASPIIEIGDGIFGIGVNDGDFGDSKDKTPEKTKIEEGFRLGYSFYLCVAAGIVMLIGGGLLYWWNRKNAGNNESETDVENKTTTQI